MQGANDRQTRIGRADALRVSLVKLGIGCLAARGRIPAELVMFGFI